MWVGMIPRVTLRFTLGYEPLALLGHSTFQVVWPVVLTRIFTELSGFPQIILGQRDKRVIIILSEAVFCVGYRLSSIILSEAGRWTEGAWKSKKTDSTTVKTIAEPYLPASVNFYRTAIVFNS